MLCYCAEQNLLLQGRRCAPSHVPQHTGCGGKQARAEEAEGVSSSSIPTAAAAAAAAATAAAAAGYICSAYNTGSKQ
jgi:hypothetical protein